MGANGGFEALLVTPSEELSHEQLAHRTALYKQGAVNMLSFLAVIGCAIAIIVKLCGDAPAAEVIRLTAVTIGIAFAAKGFNQVVLLSCLGKSRAELLASNTTIVQAAEEYDRFN